MKTLRSIATLVHSLLSGHSTVATTPTLNRIVIDPLSIPTFKREADTLVSTSRNTAA